MTLALEAARRSGVARRCPDNPRDCRRLMRAWAVRWRTHARQRDQGELATLCLDNARVWQDRGAWAERKL